MSDMPAPPVSARPVDAVPAPAAAVIEAAPARRDSAPRDAGQTADSDPEDAGPSTPSTASVPAPRRLPQLGPPEVLGLLAGPGSAPPDLQLYGTDLGWTFEHRGALTVLFGDTWPSARFICETSQPEEDDVLASLPLMPEAVPRPSFVRRPDAPNALANLRVNVNGRAIPMGIGCTPLSGFSDGQNAFAIMGHLAFSVCPEAASDGCGEEAGLRCVHDLGLCQPVVGGAVLACDPSGIGGGGCVLGQRCVAPASGYCVDEGSSQYDGTRASLPYAIARDNELALQRPDEPNVFDSVFTFVSKKFHNPVARTVTSLGSAGRAADYRPGHGALLIWGRPAFFSEQGRQAHLYLLRHTLPLEVRGGRLAFAPEYFAGLDSSTGEPRWSPMQRDAVALALDGVVGGAPREPLQIINQMAISWLGPPIEKWIMLYGGDVPDAMLVDAAGDAALRGPLRVRYADDPWGPWSPPQDYLSPGSPKQRGAAYGPGGYLYHPECQDTAGETCARSDPVRPLDAALLPGCALPVSGLDVGRMYGANIIDAYTAPAGAGLDITWNLSTWNPYAVVLLRSHVSP